MGQVSQSAQWAPFNVRIRRFVAAGLDLIPVQAQYDWLNTTDNLIIPNPDNTLLNPYKGGASMPLKSMVSSCLLLLSIQVPSSKQLVAFPLPTRIVTREAQAASLCMGSSISQGLYLYPSFKCNR